MKPELKQAIAELRKVVENLHDINKEGRLIISDIEFQADKLEKAIDQVQIHGGGTGTE